MTVYQSNIGLDHQGPVVQNI